tara:strand:- start:329 stop:727 length:399 start_codon:yes stop_codon:yes gene_type:complete
MSNKEDPNYVVKVEAAIKEKYGEEAVQNPKKFWTQEKEKEYLKQLKEFYNKSEDKSQDKDRVGDVYVSKKILNRDSNRQCPVCDKYSFDKKDDLYMNKFKCCFGCYIQYVHGREKRWRSGWRPDKNTMAIID